MNICCCLYVKVNECLYCFRNVVSTVINRVRCFCLRMCKKKKTNAQISKILDNFSTTRGPKARVRTRSVRNPRSELVMMYICSDLDISYVSIELRNVSIHLINSGFSQIPSGKFRARKQSVQALIQGNTVLLNHNRCLFVCLQATIVISILLQVNLSITIIIFLHTCQPKKRKLRYWS